MKTPKIETTVFTLAFCVSLMPLVAGTDMKHAAEAQFKKADANGDGKVTPAEHAMCAEEMFLTMDANKDKKVTAAEMDAAHESMMGRKSEKSEMSAAEKIKMIDKNADGLVSAQEHADGSSSMFGKMDTNGDGFLTEAELAEGHAKMMKKHDGQDS